jgi:hypothetical protein
MDNKRVYYKANRKSAKTSAIRYDVVQFDIATKKSGKPTVQALFDYLLAMYVNEWSFGSVQVEQKKSPQKPLVEEVAAWKNFNYFLSRIKNIESHEEGLDFVLEIEGCGNLSPKEVFRLKELLKSKWA